MQKVHKAVVVDTNKTIYEAAKYKTRENSNPIIKR